MWLTCVEPLVGRRRVRERTVTQLSPNIPLPHKQAHIHIPPPKVLRNKLRIKPLPRLLLSCLMTRGWTAVSQTLSWSASWTAREREKGKSLQRKNHPFFAWDQVSTFRACNWITALPFPPSHFNANLRLAALLEVLIEQRPLHMFRACINQFAESTQWFHCSEKQRKTIG